jgi:hypothetical protein
MGHSTDNCSRWGQNLCTFCHKLGHAEEECWTKDKDKRPARPPKNKQRLCNKQTHKAIQPEEETEYTEYACLVINETVEHANVGTVISQATQGRKGDSTQYNTNNNHMTVEEANTAKYEADVIACAAMKEAELIEYEGKDAEMGPPLDKTVDLIDADMDPLLDVTVTAEYTRASAIPQTDWTDKDVGPSMNEDPNTTNQNLSLDNQCKVARNGHFMDTYNELIYSDIEDNVVTHKDDCIEPHDWITDSATMSHICNTKNTFIQYMPAQKRVSVCGVGGIITCAEGRGTVQIISLQKGGLYKLTLNDVLYIPDNRNNLLSLGQWAQAGNQFTGGQELHLFSKDSICVATGHLTSTNLYKVRCSTRPTPVQINEVQYALNNTTMPPD